MPRAIAALAILIVAGCQANVQQPDMAGARPSFQTQVEKDADAIMEGIRQARRSPLDQHMRVAPSTEHAPCPPNETDSLSALRNDDMGAQDCWSEWAWIAECASRQRADER